MKKLWSRKQEIAIELLAQGELSYKEIAAKLDIAYTTLGRWRIQEEFQYAVRKRCHDLLKELEPKLYNAAIKAVEKNGSAPHIKILLERLERLEDIAQGTQGSVTFTWSPAIDTQRR